MLWRSSAAVAKFHSKARTVIKKCLEMFTGIAEEQDDYKKFHGQSGSVLQAWLTAQAGVAEFRQNNNLLCKSHLTTITAKKGQTFKRHPGNQPDVLIQATPTRSSSWAPPCGRIPRS